MKANSHPRPIFKLAGCIVTVLLGALLTARAQAPGALYATVVNVEGEPQIRSTTGELRPAVEGGRVRMGETVTSDADDRLQLSVQGPDGDEWGYFCSGSNSEFVLDEYALESTPQRNVVLRFLRVATGWIVALNPDRFKVPTRFGGGGIRGTEFQLDSLSEDSITWTLWEGGPIDLYGTPDWGSFDDSLFSDPVHKGLETMLVQEFADAASLAGVDFMEYLSGGPALLSLTDPSTSATTTRDGVTGPMPATVSPAVCVPEATWNPWVVGLFCVPISLLAFRKRKALAPPRR